MVSQASVSLFVPTLVLPAPRPVAFPWNIAGTLRNNITIIP